LSTDNIPLLLWYSHGHQKELIASDKDVKEIERVLGVDSLGYLSIESLIKCIGIERNSYARAA